MKKLFFTLSICLFSLGAFAFGNNDNQSLILLENSKVFSENFAPINCVIEVTTIITIDHGTYIETITVVTYEPCPISAG
ncbi:hypothetical protein [Aequorivita echinoideorum]|uniref:DUF1573 domain-containing protein n=1 Tax=Aequorivita echinoideorum TaxID=1549647 RepID=A0ABS5S220_9FLAO|nr:hypothetical protein [Aequorivita echinoideorum]MBT0607253.1 hypothetical protein [Aequorivita echinoideorum]